MSGNKAKVVDVHYHALSPGLAKEIAGCVSSHVRLGLSKNVSISTDGTEVPMVTEEEQLAKATQAGIDILALSIQSVAHLVPEELSNSPEGRFNLSQAINDYLASVCRRFQERFMAFADIPLVGLGESAIEEMRRALNGLGLHGINLWSSYDGKPLDATEFRPFFEEANRQRALIFLHPTFRMEEALRDYHMYVLVRFPYETTLAMGRLAYSGVLEQFPDLTFILSHAGGTIPFLWWRLDYGYMENYPTCRSHIQVPPTNYLKRCCYYDTALSDTDSLMLAYKRVGEDHLMLGTDTPYRTEALSQTIKMVEAMDIPDGSRAKILGGNALALIGRTSFS